MSGGGNAAAGEARRYGRTAGLLTVALATAGLLTYGFFAVASHTLETDDYGQIVVLWSSVFLIVSTLFRPIEQLLSRTIAELEAQRTSISHALRVAASIQLGVALIFAAVSFALYTPLKHGLFKDHELYFFVMVGAVIAFGAEYFARGFLAGRRDFPMYATLLLVDGIGRLTFALIVALGISDGPNMIAIGICLAPAMSLVVVPVAIRRERDRDLPADGLEPPAAAAEAGVVAEAAPEFTLAQGGGFAAAVLVVMLSEQIFLNGGPLFAQAVEGSAAAGFIFNVLMVARAPVVLFQAVAASLLPHLTRLRSHGGETSEEAFRLSVRLTVSVIAGLAALAVLGVLAVGPDAMQIAFGDKFTYDRLGLALVAAGMGFYLSAATLNQAALAQGQARRSAFCWAACAIGFIGWNLVPGIDVFRRIEIGFLVVAAVLCSLMWMLYRNPKPRAEDAITPGSPRELEARLAAADEAM